MTESKIDVPLSNLVTLRTLEQLYSFLERNHHDICCLDLSDQELPPPRPDSLNGHDTGRVILMSMSYDNRAQQWVERLHPGAFLVKPVSQEQLAAAADVLYARHQQKNMAARLMKRQWHEALITADGIFRQAPQGFIISDPDGRTIYTNKTLADMLGFRQDEIIGTTPGDLLDPGSVAKFAEEYKSRSQGKGFSTYEVSLRGRKSHPIDVMVTALGVYSESGTFLGSFGRIAVKESELNAQELGWPVQEKNTQRSICKLLNVMLPSLLTMKSPERMRNILNFMEAFVKTDSGENGFLSDIRKECGSPLSSTEVALCAMIKSGLTSKQISEIFGVSEKAVAFHRAKLRMKLGLKGRHRSLTDFLCRVPG